MNKITEEIEANIIKPGKAVNKILKKWPIHKAIYDHIKEIESINIKVVLKNINLDKRVYLSPFLIILTKDKDAWASVDADLRNVDNYKDYPYSKYTPELPKRVLKRKLIFLKIHVKFLNTLSDKELKVYCDNLKSVISHEWVHVRQFVKNGKIGYDRIPYKDFLRKRKIASELTEKEKEFLQYYSQLDEIMTHALDATNAYKSNEIKTLEDILGEYKYVSDIYPTTRKRFLKYFYLYMKDGNYNKSEIKTVLRKYWK
jgi:hypothetical protein